MQSFSTPSNRSFVRLFVRSMCTGTAFYSNSKIIACFIYNIRQTYLNSIAVVVKLLLRPLLRFPLLFITIFQAIIFNFVIWTFIFKPFKQHNNAYIHAALNWIRTNKMFCSVFQFNLCFSTFFFSLSFFLPDFF